MLQGIGINKMTNTYFGTTADKDLEVIMAAELSEHIMASRKSVQVRGGPVWWHVRHSDARTAGNGAARTSSIATWALKTRRSRRWQPVS